MSGELSMSEFGDSQNAIREYINAGVEKRGKHEAPVRILKDNRVVFKNTLSVITLIDTNESLAEIIWPKKHEKDYYIKYSNRFQKFYYNCDTLEIECVDKNGENIVIMIG